MIILSTEHTSCSIVSCWIIPRNPCRVVIIWLFIYVEEINFIKSMYVYKIFVCMIYKNTVLIKWSHVFKFFSSNVLILWEIYSCKFNCSKSLNIFNYVKTINFGWNSYWFHCWEINIPKYYFSFLQEKHDVNYWV